MYDKSLESFGTKTLSFSKEYFAKTTECKDTI